eukprot:scaffold8260_cov109-Isochrysis_galbana.AAC.3
MQDRPGEFTSFNFPPNVPAPFNMAVRPPPPVPTGRAKPRTVHAGRDGGVAASPRCSGHPEQHRDALPRGEGEDGTGPAPDADRGAELHRQARRAFGGTVHAQVSSRRRELNVAAAGGGGGGGSGDPLAVAMASSVGVWATLIQAHTCPPSRDRCSTHRRSGPHPSYV